MSPELPKQVWSVLFVSWSDTVFNLPKQHGAELAGIISRTISVHVPGVLGCSPVKLPLLISPSDELFGSSCCCPQSFL